MIKVFKAVKAVKAFKAVKAVKVFKAVKAFKAVKVKYNKVKYKYGGHPAPAGPAQTNDLCGQYVKGKIKVKIKIRCGVDVGFNILTAFKDRIGHAPKGRGAIHILNFMF